MPYAVNEDLPASVRGHLPPHAQDIYREAFNHAWERYGGDEPTAHRVAWAAVKRQYVQRLGVWERRGPLKVPALLGGGREPGDGSPQRPRPERMPVDHVLHARYRRGAIEA